MKCIQRCPLFMMNSANKIRRTSKIPCKKRNQKRGRRDMLLVPYIILVSFYLWSTDPLSNYDPPETPVRALIKVAPILYLACYVGLTPRFRHNVLAQGARVGLIFSSMGDACLVWKDTHFLHGMFFFSLAQMAYIFGLSSWFDRGQYPRKHVKMFGLACVCSYLYIVTGMTSPLMAMCVLGYTVLLFTMANLSMQRNIIERNRGSSIGAVGATLFVISDLLIAVCKWKLVFPFCEEVIMLTYYAAQACIAAGAVNSARSRRQS
ncbi:hypothetical protein V1264_018759 [Littorina saxatilis]|uniref:lysoplasmalogenase n=3 Tax=Littorina saxatilis TaxID=31220 RepID=A0AAN9BIU7_9CAEN